MKSSVRKLVGLPYRIPTDNHLTTVRYLRWVGALLETYH